MSQCFYTMLSCLKYLKKGGRSQLDFSESLLWIALFSFVNHRYWTFHNCVWNKAFVNYLKKLLLHTQQWLRQSSLFFSCQHYSSRPRALRAVLWSIFQSFSITYDFKRSTKIEHLRFIIRFKSHSFAEKSCPWVLGEDPKQNLGVASFLQHLFGMLVQNGAASFSPFNQDQDRFPKFLRLCFNWYRSRDKLRM